MPMRPKAVELTVTGRKRLEGALARPTSSAREYVCSEDPAAGGGRQGQRLRGGQARRHQADVEPDDPQVRGGGGVEAALADAPDRGKSAEISEADELWAVEKACVPPKDCGHVVELWYPVLLVCHIRSVAEGEGHLRMATVSVIRLCNIMHDARPQPWKVDHLLL